MTRSYMRHLVACVMHFSPKLFKASALFTFPKRKKQNLIQENVRKPIGSKLLKMWGYINCYPTLLKVPRRFIISKGVGVCCKKVCCRNGDLRLVLVVLDVWLLTWSQEEVMAVYYATWSFSGGRGEVFFYKTQILLYQNLPGNYYGTSMLHSS